MNRIEHGVLLAALFTLAACSAGPREVRLEPPALQVESLRVEDGRVHFRLLVHNRNDHELLLESAAMTMRIDDAQLFNGEWQLDLDISPRGRELIRLDAPAMPIAAEILSALEDARQTSIQFELYSEIAIEGQRDTKLSQPGFLYPVPGQPGHYR